MKIMLNNEKIKRELENRLATVNFKIEKWESVKHLTKKDGTEYQSRSKAFDGCKYLTNYPVYDVFHPVVEITGRCDGLQGVNDKWVSDTIYCYAYEDDYHKDRYKGKEYVKPESYSRPVYVLSNDEIMEEIKIKIEYLKGYKERLEKMLLDCDGYVEKVQNKLSELLQVVDDINEETKDKDSKFYNNSDLYYIIREQLTKQF